MWMWSLTATTNIFFFLWFWEPFCLQDYTSFICQIWCFIGKMIFFITWCIKEGKIQGLKSGTKDSYEEASCTAIDGGSWLALVIGLYYDATALIRKLQTVLRLTSSIVFICLIDLQSCLLMIVCFTCQFSKFGLVL